MFVVGVSQQTDACQSGICWVCPIVMSLLIVNMVIVMVVDTTAIAFQVCRVGRYSTLVHGIENDLMSFTSLKLDACEQPWITQVCLGGQRVCCDTRQNQALGPPARVDLPSP